VWLRSSGYHRREGTESVVALDTAAAAMVSYLTFCKSSQSKIANSPTTVMHFVGSVPGLQRFVSMERVREQIDVMSEVPCFSVYDRYQR